MSTPPSPELSPWERDAHALQLAKSKTTPPEDFRALADHELLRVRNAVARNPNAPGDVLVALLERTSAQVLKNPAFSLLLLENPALFTQLSARAARQIARSKHVPDAFMDWAEQQHPWSGLSDELLDNPHVPRSRRLRIFWARPAMTHDGAAGRRFVRQLVGLETYRLLLRVGVRFTHADKDPQDPSLTSAELQGLADQGPLGARLAMSHPRCPPGVVARFARGSEGAKLLAMGHPNLPDECKPALASDPSALVRAAAADRIKTLPGDLLLQLCADPSEAVRLAVVVRRRLDEAQAAALLTGTTWAVWLAAAADRTLPPLAQERLARAEHLDVKRTLARNPDLAPGACRLLGSDGQRQVRQLIAERLDAPREVLEQLRYDRSLRVKKAAQSSVRRLNHLARKA